MEDKNQTKTIFAVIGIAILLTLVVGLTFAIYSYEKTGEENSITTGTISVSFVESSNVVSLANALPIQDENAAKTSLVDGAYFDFSVSSTSSDAMEVSYTIKAVEVAASDPTNQLSRASVQIYLTELASQGSTSETVLVNATANTLFGANDEAVLVSSATHTHTTAETKTSYYRLRMWVTYGTDASNWDQRENPYEYKLKIKVESEI